MNVQYYIGVDAGGSKCRARIEDTSGNVLGHTETGPATIRRGADFAATAIQACLFETLKAAGLEKTDLQEARIVVGAAGTESSADTEKLIERLSSTCDSKVMVVSDARTACVGAHQGDDGAIVIVGTGSIAYGLVGGKTVRVGGFGFPSSDLGSGAYIGLTAVQHALMLIGESQPQPAFTSAILAVVGNAPDQLAAWTNPATATDYATLAPIVVKHANTGDPDAARILHTAAEHISVLVQKISARGAPRICLMGGLSPIISPIMKPQVQALLSIPKGGAIDGAILLARSNKQ